MSPGYIGEIKLLRLWLKLLLPAVVFTFRLALLLVFIAAGDFLLLANLDTAFLAGIFGPNTVGVIVTTGFSYSFLILYC